MSPNSDDVTNASQTSVLIAGGGPVGLALAIELGLCGVDCVAVEKRDGAIPVPKMSQVSSRSMEHCRRWGIAEEVKRAAWSADYPMDFVYVTNLTGKEIARLKVPSYAERGEIKTTPEGARHCPQTYFDPILAARAAKLKTVSLRYNTRLDGFTQASDGIEAQLPDVETRRGGTLNAQYLIGCDGPDGVVRSALGIELGGAGVIANSTNIFFKSPELASLHDKGWARFYRPIDAAGCWGELIPIDGKELWRLTVFHEEERPKDPDVYLARMAGAEFDYEILSILPWERRDYVAASYRDRRVLIAGDAAHQCSPTGGYGMHTGLVEAVNLAWKLWATLAGWGGPGLLDSYQAECRALARYIVTNATYAFEEITSLPGLAGVDGDAAVREFNDFLQKSSDNSVSAVAERVKSYYSFWDSPICILSEADDPEPDPAKQSPSTMPGSPAPHAWLAPGQSTLDLFAGQFTLLSFGADDLAAGPMLAAAEARGVPLKLIQVDDPDIARLYERKLVLVRPAAYVAWRGDQCPADAAAVIDHVRGA